MVAASVHGIAWCLALLAGAAWAAAPARSLVVYCSHDPDACDPARFGAPAERQRLLARWQKEIGDARR